MSTPAAVATWEPLDEFVATVGELRQDDAAAGCERTVGRQDALDAIYRFVARGRHVLLLGPHGVGKSHLLRVVERDLHTAEENTLTLGDFKAQHGLLVDLCLALHQADHLARFQDESDPERVAAALKRLRIGELADLVAASLRGRGYIIVIDNLETLTPSGVPTLQALTETATVVAACKSEQLERINAVVDRFNRIELGPLPDEDILDLLWARVDQAAVSDPALLERRVLEQAAGNPGAVVDAAHKLASTATLSDIRAVAPTANPGITRVDLTWTLLFAAAMLVAARYVARAADSTTAYAVFGVLSAFAMVFRLLLFRLSRRR